jgi:hypothetical protein
MVNMPIRRHFASTKGSESSDISCHPLDSFIVLLTIVRLACRCKANLQCIRTSYSSTDSSLIGIAWFPPRQKALS